MTRDEAIEQLDWYFNEDDGIAADGKTHAAYTALRTIARGDYRPEETLLSICPSCGHVMGWNSYFGHYICSNCGWEGSR